MRKTIHISLTTKSIPVRFDVVQYATYPEIEFICDDFVPSGSARIYVKKPSGAKVYNDCTIEGNSIIYKVTNQTFAELGINECQLEVMMSDGTAVSFKMFAHSSENIIDSEAVESTDEFTALEDALSTVGQYDSRIAQNESDISDLQSDVADNTSAIATNTANISTNTTNIATNTADIAQNTADIADNASAIQTNADNITSLQEWQTSFTPQNVHGSAVSIANNTRTEIASINLDVGTYLVIGVASFTANATGYREINLSTSSGGANASRFLFARHASSPALETVIEFSGVVAVSTQMDFYLNARQTSGGALSVTGGITAIRFK